MALDETYAAWLQEQRGGRACPETVQAGIAAIIDAGQSLMGDIVTGPASDGDKIVWAAIIEEATRERGSGGVTVSAIDQARALGWVLLPTAAVERFGWKTCS